jgi:ATP-dependent RNA helicase DHX29
MDSPAAETSVTIADVVYVVDCGKLKERRHNAARGMSLLVEDFVSQVRPGKTQIPPVAASVLVCLQWCDGCPALLHRLAMAASRAA